MRFRSIIALLIGVAVFTAGILLCKNAQKQADAQGIDLFAEKTGDTTVIEEPEFTEADVTTIIINTIDAKIFIQGGQEKSYVEFINFNPNLFVYSQSGKTITISELKDINSLLEFWENGLAFKGMRNLYYQLTGAFKNLNESKEIHIFLSDTTQNINLFDMNLNNSEVQISDVTLAADYIIKSENAKISLSNLNNTSKIELITNDRLDLEMKNVQTANLLINSSEDKNLPVKNAQIQLQEVLTLNSNICFDEGSLELSFLSDSFKSFEGYYYSLASGGNIKFRNNSVTSPYTYVGINNSVYHYALNITSKSGIITIN